MLIIERRIDVYQHCFRKHPVRLRSPRLPARLPTMASSADLEPAIFAEIRAVLNERIMAIDGAMATYVCARRLNRPPVFALFCMN